jgi:hypothetical protein
MAKQKLLLEISKEPDQIEKRHVKDTAWSVAYKQQQYEKSMLASKCAIELLYTESAIMMFEAAHKCPSSAVLNAQACLIATRMHSARAGCHNVPSEAVKFDYQIKLIAAHWSMLSVKMVSLFVFAALALLDADYIVFILPEQSDKQTGTGILLFKLC